MRKTLKKAILSGLTILVLFAGIGSVPLASAAGDNPLLVLKGHSRIITFDPVEFEAVDNYHFNDYFSAAENTQWHETTGVLSKTGNFVATGSYSPREMMSFNVITGEFKFLNNVDHNNPDIDPDIKTWVEHRMFDYAGDLGFLTSWRDPGDGAGFQQYYYPSGHVNPVGYFDGAPGPALPYYDEQNDWFYTTGGTTGNGFVQRIDPVSWTLDKQFTGLDPAFRGITSTPEGFMAITGSRGALYIYDFDQDPGSELLGNWSLPGDLASTDSKGVEFYGETYKDGFYWLEHDGVIRDYSIDESDNLILNWSQSLVGLLWSGIFDHDVHDDYLFTIHYIDDARSRLYKIDKTDGSVVDSYDTPDYGETGLNGFYHTKALGVYYPDEDPTPPAFDITLTPGDESTIIADESIIGLAWANNISGGYDWTSFEISMKDTETGINYKRKIDITTTSKWWPDEFALARWDYTPDAGIIEFRTGWLDYFGSPYSPDWALPGDPDPGREYTIEVVGHSDIHYLSSLPWFNYIYHVIGDEYVYDPPDWLDDDIMPPVEFDEDFQSFYDEHGSYEEPLAAIAAVAGIWDGIAGRAARYLGVFRDRFDLADARDIAGRAGGAVAHIRGHLTSFSDLFGGFPLGAFLLTWIAVQIAVVLWRIIRWLISLIPLIG